MPKKPRSKPVVSKPNGGFIPQPIIGNKTLADQVTAALKLPVPATVDVQVDVCVVRIDAGEQATETEVIVGGTVIVTVADPDLVASCVDVAVTVAVPVPVGVKTPALLTDPIVAGLTVHVTPEL